MQADLLVVGGGINGAGIAREAAGRGLSVILIEKDDLAGHTSSASTKLIHGGLRYLEQFDFGLVRESLQERERLLRAAPHIVRPLEFVLPLTHSVRPAWMIRAGLWLYDHLGDNQNLPGSSAVRLNRDTRGDGLKSRTGRAFTYWDCRVQDSRLTVLNAVDAAERGATVLTRTELMEARRQGASWLARIHGPGGERTVRARALVNATGPWVEELFGRIAGALPRQTVRLVKGSHVVMPKLYPGEHAFILQNPDRRMVFAIPFEESFTLVGTTEVEWRGPAGAAEISEEEIDYLLETIRRNFFAEVSRGDIVWTYSGVRALCDDGARNASNVTRDYRLDLDGSRPEAPLLSVFGGKITTYRRLAEQAVDRIASMLSWPGMSWTKEALLPGGDIPDLEPDAYARELTINYPALPPRLLTRLAGTYGTRATRVLDDVRNAEDLGEHFGCGLYAREVDYLVGQEWARTPEDILFRRTKLGLHMGREGVDRLEAHLAGSA